MPNLICETCGSTFYVPPCRLRQAEKMNCSVRFCKMACYKKDGDKNPFWGRSHSEKSVQAMRVHPNRTRFAADQTNPNRRFDPSIFQGKTVGWWRRFLKKTVGHCEICRFDFTDILVVHHKDRNRKNNTRDNLILLCPNCHETEHHKDRDGKFYAAQIRWHGRRKQTS